MLISSSKKRIEDATGSSVVSSKSEVRSRGGLLLFSEKSKGYEESEKVEGYRRRIRAIS